MPRPKNREDLLTLSQKNYDKLIQYVESMPQYEQEKEFLGNTLNRNIRDVLGHLYHWHLMMLGWYEVGMRGDKPDIPAKGYTWKTTPELNRVIQQKYQETPLEDIKEKLQDSHQRVFQLISSHSDEELFEKKRYKWTGTTSLGAYFISCTSSHYDWALKLIRKCKKMEKALT